MSERSFIVPETLASHFHLRPGDKVGDFGAGAGNFASVLSRVVGQQGHVYACEIQRNLVETLAERIKRERLNNVDVVWGDIEAVQGTKIDTEALDAVLLVNTLFQAEDRAGVLREAGRTLRRGGKLFIVDWSESWGGMGPQPGNIVTEGEARSLAEAAGFTFERRFDAGDHHYGLAFRES